MLVIIGMSTISRGLAVIVSTILFKVLVAIYFLAQLVSRVIISKNAGVEEIAICHVTCHVISLYSTPYIAL